MRFKGILYLILTFMIAVPLYIACSNTNTAVNKDQGSFINEIKTSRYENGTTVEIIGKDIEHFNAFQLHDKNKLIIDLPEAKLKKFLDQENVGEGCVNQIKVFQFEDEERRLARVEIDLTQEVYPEFDEFPERIKINLMHGDLETVDLASNSIASLDPKEVIIAPDNSYDPINEDEITYVENHEKTLESTETEEENSTVPGYDLEKKNIETEDILLAQILKEENIETELETDKETILTEDNVDVNKEPDLNLNDNELKTEFEEIDFNDETTIDNNINVENEKPANDYKEPETIPVQQEIDNSPEESYTPVISPKIDQSVEQTFIPESKPEESLPVTQPEKVNLQEPDPENAPETEPVLPEEDEDSEPEAFVKEEIKTEEITMEEKVEEPVIEEDLDLPLFDNEVEDILSALETQDKPTVEDITPEVIEKEEEVENIIPDVPVSWYLRDANLREFLRLVAKEYNFNLVIDPEVNSKITVHLDKVALESALITVLNSYGYGIEIREGIVRIGTLDRLSKEREREAILKQNMKMTVELKKESRSLNYASAKALKTIVEKLLTKGRSDAFAAVDERTNTLLVYDTPDNLNVIWDWVEKLDRQTKQVYIQARIVQTTKKFSRSLGIQWGGTYVADAAHGNTTGYRFPNSISIAGAAGAAVLGGGAGLIPAAVNLPTSDINSGIGILLGDTLDTVKLDIALSAAENDNETKVLSTPRVTTSDNVPGSIKFGQEYPYQTRDENGALVTSFKETVTSIIVTPHTTYDNFIKMNIEVTKDSFAGFTPQGIVYLNKNEAKMEVLVKDGDTAVIGGLNTSNVANTNEQVPLLHKIPVLGWLFKKRVKTNEKDDILIFLTPHIIR